MESSDEETVKETVDLRKRITQKAVLQATSKCSVVVKRLTDKEVKRLSNPNQVVPNRVPFSKLLANFAQEVADNECSDFESDNDDIQSIEASELGTIADESDYELDANFDDNFGDDDDMDANGEEHSANDIKKKLDEVLIKVEAEEEEELPTDPIILAQELRTTQRALKKAETELFKTKHDLKASKKAHEKTKKILEKALKHAKIKMKDKKKKKKDKENIKSTTPKRRSSAPDNQDVPKFGSLNAKELIMRANSKKEILPTLSLIKKELEKKKDFKGIPREMRITHNWCWFFQQVRCREDDQDHIDSLTLTHVVHICYFCARLAQDGRQHGAASCPLLKILDEP